MSDAGDLRAIPAGLDVLVRLTSNGDIAAEGQIRRLLLPGMRLILKRGMAEDQAENAARLALEDVISRIRRDRMETADELIRAAHGIVRQSRARSA